MLKRDHPRTRGVYTTPESSPSPKRGSSPHARGLPPPVHRGDVPQGIIPARAGFTARVIATAGFRGDHPRTRGVYTGGTTVETPNAGSSPHARGLR